MKLIISLFLLFISGCVTPDAGHKSNWYAIEKAEQIDCQKWPKREKDLRIESIKPSIDHLGNLQGFSVTTLTRTASKAHYYSPFNDKKEIDLEKLTSLELPRRAVFLGTLTHLKKRFVLAAQNTSQGIQIEARSLGDNVIRSKGLIKGEAIEDGRIVSAQQAYWLLYSTPDGAEKIIQVSFLPKNQLFLRAIPGSYEGSPVILPDPKGIFIVWKDETKPIFRFRWVPLSGPAAPPQTIALKIDQQIESWTAGTDNSRHFLVVVDGDTLIGQAQVKVLAGRFTLNSYIAERSQVIGLKNIHATEPVIGNKKGQAEAYLMNWIDEESTIARYKIGASSQQQPSYAGVFPKGTKIQETLKAGDQSFFIAKNKVDAQWNFYLCEH